MPWHTVGRLLLASGTSELQRRCCAHSFKFSLAFGARALVVCMHTGSRPWSTPNSVASWVQACNWQCTLAHVVHVHPSAVCRVALHSLLWRFEAEQSSLRLADVRCSVSRTGPVLYWHWTCHLQLLTAN